MSLLINGYLEKPSNRKDVEITNPATKEVLGSVWLAEIPDDDKILTTAKTGFEKWSSMPLSQRADILMKYADLLEENHEKIATIQSKEMGKIINEAKAEVKGSAYITRGFVERAKHLYGKSFCDNHHGLENDFIFTRREPLGVFLCIVPFNFPVELATHKIIPALIMGNSTIIKVPSVNPLAILEMVKLLIMAGVPAEAVGTMFCNVKFSSEKIITTDRIDAISLTGSTYAGISVLKDSAQHLHKVFLELGGNDPLIIFEDADIDKAVDEILLGRVFNTGQTCCASKRFIVHESVRDELAKKLTARLDTVKRGNPVDPSTEFGCLVNEKNANEVIEQVNHTVKQGAKCIYGGTVSNGTFVEPTVLVDVTKEMDIAGELEIFGPVIPIISFKTTKEAIEIANQIPYGLQGGIMTSRLELALDVASKLQCGSVVTNGSGNYRHMDMPFGGYKMTGIGREGISATLEEFSQEKTFIIKNIITP